MGGFLLQQGEVARVGSARRPDLLASHQIGALLGHEITEVASRLRAGDPPVEVDDGFEGQGDNWPRDGRSLTAQAGARNEFVIAQLELSNIPDVEADAVTLRSWSARFPAQVR